MICFICLFFNYKQKRVSWLLWRWGTTGSYTKFPPWEITVVRPRLTCLLSLVTGISLQGPRGPQKHPRLVIHCPQKTSPAMNQGTQMHYPRLSCFDTCLFRSAPSDLISLWLSAFCFWAAASARSAVAMSWMAWHHLMFGTLLVWQNRLALQHLLLLSDGLAHLISQPLCARVVCFVLCPAVIAEGFSGR